jgi:hypothetical protein
MAVTARGVSGWTSTSVQNPVVSFPAATVAGDSLFMFAGYTTNPTVLTATTPTGWTLVGTFNLGINQPLLYVFTKTADGTEGGTTLTLATSGAITWRCAIAAIANARTTALPYAHTLINGNATPATSKSTAGTLTFDTSAPSGNRYMLGFVKTSSSTNSFSLETLSGMTGVTINEIADIGNGCLMVLMTCTGGTSSTFATTFSASVDWVYVLTDLVEGLVGAAVSVTATLTASAILGHVSGAALAVTASRSAATRNVLASSTLTVTATVTGTLLKNDFGVPPAMAPVYVTNSPNPTMGAV